jgi:hypothetical protein
MTKQIRQITAAAGAVGVLLAVAPAPGGTAAATPAPQQLCAPGERVAAASLPATLSAGLCQAKGAVITHGLARVEVPPLGLGITASVLSTTGSDVLTVRHKEDGTLTIVQGESSQAAALAQAVSGCTSSAFTRLPTKVKTNYTWKYNGRGAHATVASTALAHIKTATNTITNGTDDCGIAGKPRVSNTYAGTTTAVPAANIGGTCPTTADFVNVTGWKAKTDTTVLATTCTRFYVADNTVADSDVAINSAKRWVTATTGCSNAYDLQGVMAHERGHTFGLDHVAATPANDGLTMDGTFATCSFDARTLGRGDLLGLFNIYGKA